MHSEWCWMACKQWKKTRQKRTIQMAISMRYAHGCEFNLADANLPANERKFSWKHRKHRKLNTPWHISKKTYDRRFIWLTARWQIEEMKRANRKKFNRHDPYVHCCRLLNSSATFFIVCFGNFQPTEPKWNIELCRSCSGRGLDLIQPDVCWSMTVSSHHIPPIQLLPLHRHCGLRIAFRCQ